MTLTGGGGGADPKLDKSALIAKIDEAESEKNSVVVAENAGEIVLNRKWVTQTVMTEFETAISTAKITLDTAKEQNDLNYAVSALNKAITEFKKAKKDGTNESGFSLTINGLSSFNYWDIELGLYASQNDFNPSLIPAISGYGFIFEDTVTIELFDSSTGNSWAGSGSYYIGLKISFDYGSYKYYISKSPVNFTATPNAVTNFTDYKQYVFNYTFGDFADMMGIDIPAGGMTMDAWCQQVRGMTYAQMIDVGYISQVYKNEALTQPFSGNDTVNANTKFYSTDPMGGNGTKIGEISGTITLTGVSNPAPRVKIFVNENNWSWQGQKWLSLSGSGIVNWSIPIYGEANFPSNGHFYLIVEQGSINEIYFEIPTTQAINSANASGINLGTINIKTVTMSGNINVTYNEQSVPYVRIWAYKVGDDSDSIGSILLESPAPNTPWSMSIYPLDSPTNVYFKIEGYPSRYSDTPVFNVNANYSNPVSVYNQNVPGINIDLGNITDTQVNLPAPSDLYPFPDGKWQYGYLLYSYSERWYSFSVESDHTYYIWWKDRDNAESYGLSNTADVKVAAYYSNGTQIFNEDRGIDNDNYYSFDANTNGTVYVRVYMHPSSSDDGQYFIAYSTDSWKPGIGTQDDPYRIIPDEWVDGIIDTGEVYWYYILTMDGSTYNIWWNDKTDGDGTKSADIDVYAYTSSNVPISLASNDSAWSTPVSFSVTSSGLVLVKVCLHNDDNSNIGDFSITYSRYDTRPSK